jgi:hypothetical protein
MPNPKKWKEGTEESLFFVLKLYCMHYAVMYVLVVPINIIHMILFSQVGCGQMKLIRSLSKVWSKAVSYTEWTIWQQSL